jgi:hypothetical protein
MYYVLCIMYYVLCIIGDVILCGVGYEVRGMGKTVIKEFPL